MKKLILALSILCLTAISGCKKDEPSPTSTNCGCTDPTAVNYNANVTCDDGSCHAPKEFELKIQILQLSSYDVNQKLTYKLFNNNLDLLATGTTLDPMTSWSTTNTCLNPSITVPYTILEGVDYNLYYYDVNGEWKYKNIFRVNKSETNPGSYEVSLYEMDMAIGGEAKMRAFVIDNVTDCSSTLLTVLAEAWV